MILSLGKEELVRLGVHNVKVPLPVSNNLLDESHLLELGELHVLLGMAFEHPEEEFVATVALGAEDNITLFKTVQKKVSSAAAGRGCSLLHLDWNQSR